MRGWDIFQRRKSASAGLLETKTDGRGVTCVYAYDNWRRDATNTYTGSLPEQQLTTIMQYEPRGYVTSITEQFASTNTGPATSIQRTNNFTYDAGFAAGPGGLTSMGSASGAASQWGGTPDAFSRVSAETNNTILYSAYGHVNGQATVSLSLDAQPLAVTAVGTNAMLWNAQMELTPGTHQLTVAALHPSGLFTALATNTFTNSISGQTTGDTFDDVGNITQRVWLNSNGTTNRIQTLSWDARGRLHAVTERDANNSGYNWTATYDELSRRLSTTSFMVTNGFTLNTLPTTINSYYDPYIRVTDPDTTVCRQYRLIERIVVEARPPRRTTNGGASIRLGHPGGPLFFPRAKGQDGDHRPVPDLGDGAAVEEVAEETMAVTGHGDEIAVFGGGHLQDLGGRIAQRQHGGDGQVLGAQPRGDEVEIGAVIFHLLGLGELEFVEIAGRPAIGHMQQQEAGAEALGQFRGVREDGFIRRPVFESDEDLFIHGSAVGQPPPTITRQASLSASGRL
jgi:hypothetical protein